MSKGERLRDFFAELKRRKVYRVTAIYLVLAIGGLELASVLLPSTRLPEWFDELFLGMAIMGLPLVLVLAWSFDITDAGIERTPEKRAMADRSGPTSAGSHPGHAPGARELVASATTGAQPGRTAAPVVTADPSVPALDRTGPPTTAASHRPLDPLVVAVLPFDNLSGSEAAEPFALGLHDDLLTELSRASALTVISRTSVRGYLGTNKPLPEIARELGAGTIVEGGVQQAGNRVRLNVQLIDARTDRHLWAERYDRDLTTETIFELQSELAAKVMAQLHARLTATEAAAPVARRTEDLEAYRLVMTAREALIDRSEAGFLRAVELTEQAIARDPEYAMAWAGLADALIGLVDYGHVDSRNALVRGAEASRRALDLDPNLAEAHTAWGRYRTAVRDAPGSAQAHARAIELQPSAAGAYQWSCWANLLLDRGPEAVAFGKKAVRLDPLDPEASGNLAMACLMVGMPEAALEESRRILAVHPTFEYARWVEGLGLQALGRLEEAVGSFAPLRDRWTMGWPELARATVAAAAEDRDAVRAAAEGLRAAEGPTRTPDDLGAARSEALFQRAMMAALLGRTDEAFDTIRAESPLPWPETLYLYVQPDLATSTLADDPRFGPLLEDVRRSWQVGAS